MTPALAASRIRDLNDRFRAAGPAGGDWMITDGVQAEGRDFMARAVAEVRAFDRFTADNDPYGEHDFGAFALAGERLFWKIDCYDRALRYGSAAPADPNVTRRVMTIMLASEY